MKQQQVLQRRRGCRRLVKATATTSSLVSFFLLKYCHHLPQYIIATTITTTAAASASSAFDSSTNTVTGANVYSKSNTIPIINPTTTTTNTTNILNTDTDQGTIIDTNDDNNDDNDNNSISSIGTRPADDNDDFDEDDILLTDNFRHEHGEDEGLLYNCNDNDDCCLECREYDDNNSEEQYMDNSEHSQQVVDGIDADETTTMMTMTNNNEENVERQDGLYQQQQYQYPESQTISTTIDSDPYMRKNSRQVLDAIIGRTSIPIIASLVFTTIMNSFDPILQRHLIDSTASNNSLMSTTTTTIIRDTVNHCFLFVLSILNYIPTITAPMVAGAVGNSNYNKAQEHVGSSLFLCYLLGSIATGLLLYQPKLILNLIATTTANNNNEGIDTQNEIIQLLRIRSLSIIPILISSSAFAGFRGSLDTITPLKVSLITQYV
jgi:MatE